MAIDFATIVPTKRPPIRPGPHVEQYILIDEFEGIFDQCPYHSIDYTKKLIKEEYKLDFEDIFDDLSYIMIDYYLYLSYI